MFSRYGDNLPSALLDLPNFESFAREELNSINHKLDIFIAARYKQALLHLGLLRSFLVRFSSVHDAVDLIETFDFARHCSCCRAVLVMCLKQCWASPPSVANAGGLRSRKPPANERHDSFTLTCQNVGQFSRSDGPRPEKGGPRTASATACCDAWDLLSTPKQQASFC